MQLKEFTRKVCEAMKKEFAAASRIEVREITKNNGVVLQGLMIATEERNVVPTVYLDSFWEAYEAGIPFAEIVRQLAEIYRSADCRKSMNMEFFRDFDKVKDNICYRLIGKKQNEKMLREIPHIDYLDLTVCFFYAFKEAPMGAASILIHQSHMELWGVSVLELLELAKKNTPRMFPGTIFSMDEVLEDCLDGREREDREYAEFLQQIPMKILSNTVKINGAVSVLYEGMLEKIGEQYGRDFYVLPSSVHELILIPDTDDRTAEELKEIVMETNRTQVAPEEVLSDSVYYYCRKEKVLKKIL